MQEIKTLRVQKWRTKIDVTLKPTATKFRKYPSFIFDDPSRKFHAETKVIFEINRGAIIDTYELTTSGNIIHVDRNFPNNTHGLLITNFFENKLKKLENYEKWKE